MVTGKKDELLYQSMNDWAEKIFWNVMLTAVLHT